MTIGQPGSGKSTLARAMGGLTGLPVVHIDHIHWMPGWVERSREEKTRACREVEAREAWIFEGGHSATWDTRMARAEMIIWLDVPVAKRFWRVVWRTWRFRGQSRPDLPAGCLKGWHGKILFHLAHAAPGAPGDHGAVGGAACGKARHPSADIA